METSNLIVIGMQSHSRQLAVGVGVGMEDMDQWLVFLALLDLQAAFSKRPWSVFAGFRLGGMLLGVPPIHEGTPIEADVAASSVFYALAVGYRLPIKENYRLTFSIEYTRSSVGLSVGAGRSNNTNELVIKGIGLKVAFGL